MKIPVIVLVLLVFTATLIFLRERQNGVASPQKEDFQSYVNENAAKPETTNNALVNIKF